MPRPFLRPASCRIPAVAPLALLFCAAAMTAPLSTALGALPDGTLVAGSAVNAQAPDDRAGLREQARKKRGAAPRGVAAAGTGVIDHLLQTPCPESGAPAPKVAVSINYPSVGDSEIDSDIRDWVSRIASVFESHLNLAAASDFPPDDGEAEYGQAADAPRFELFGDYTVSRPSRNAVSITFELWNYSGASQGNLDVMTLNYSALSGKRLDLVDIFEDPDLALRIMSDYSRKTLETRLGAARRTHMLLAGTEPLAENFSSLTLTPDGVRINFQPYQVAPWAAGIQKVEMPLDELALARPMLALWDKS